MVHWPGNPPVRIDLALSIARGDACNVSSLALGAHTGTHMDAPRHFFEAGPGIDTMPLTAAIGPARVLAMNDATAIHAPALEPLAIQPGERILFKTRNSAGAWQSDTFDEDFVYIARDAAEYLAARHVLLVGVDYLSVGGYAHDGPETHRALLGAGVWIVEGLNLAPVAPGAYELMCLPLRLQGADGAPARAIVRPLP